MTPLKGKSVSAFAATDIQRFQEYAISRFLEADDQDWKFSLPYRSFQNS